MNLCETWMWNMRSPPFRYSITKNRWLCIEGWKEGGKEDRIEEMERQREGGSNRGNGATEGWREREERRKGKMVQEGERE